MRECCGQVWVDREEAAKVSEGRVVTAKKSRGGEYGIELHSTEGRVYFVGRTSYLDLWGGPWEPRCSGIVAPITSHS